jgi:parallel beta-helix repeat protein
MNRVVFASLTILCLLSVYSITGLIQVVKADGAPIYIHADGSITPPTAPIYTADNITYTLTGNITANADGIVVERDSIVVNGAGYTVTGSRSGNGTVLTNRSNVTVKNLTMKNFTFGVYLDSSSGNVLSGNNVAYNGYGIYVRSSSGNTLSGNNVSANNGIGIGLSFSPDNTLSGNHIAANNWYGIMLGYSSDNNTLSGNNVTNNEAGIYLDYSSGNTLSGNVMVRNGYNFEVNGSVLSDFMQSVHTSNLVDGKPVYYFVNQSNIIVNADAYPKVGYLGFVNCVNVTAQGMNLTNNGQGLLLAFTNDSKISGNNISNSWYGIVMVASSGDALYGNNVTANSSYGIMLRYASNNTLSGNDVAGSAYGIGLSSSLNNTLSGNKITKSAYGIGLDSSPDNTLSSNNIMENDGYGIWFHSSSENRVFHNSLVNNSIQIRIEGSNNTWDDGYPSGGNYWSDYNGTDLYYGPGQNETGSDGIGDRPYEIDASNADRFPLMGNFCNFTVSTSSAGYQSLYIISNSTVSSPLLFYWLDIPYNGLQPGQYYIDFFVEGESGSVGFCRLMVPRTVFNSSSYTVLVDFHRVNATLLPISNSAQVYLYFTFTHSTREILVTIPEFSLLALSLFMIGTLLAVMVYRKKSMKTRQSS